MLRGAKTNEHKEAPKCHIQKQQCVCVETLFDVLEETVFIPRTHLLAQSTNILLNHVMGRCGKLQDYVIVLVRLFYNLCIALEWLF